MRLPYIQWPDGKIGHTMDHPVISILPGSFNPLHAGHQYLYEQALNLGFPTYFEISRLHRSKDPISDEEILRRAQQFIWKFPLVINEVPLYRDKVLFYKAFGAKQVNFYCGSDVAHRLLHDEGIDEIESWENVNFYISERIMPDEEDTHKTRSYDLWGSSIKNFHCLHESFKSEELKRISSSRLRCERNKD